MCFYKHGNEPPCPIKGGKFLDYQRLQLALKNTPLQGVTKLVQLEAGLRKV